MPSKTNQHIVERADGWRAVFTARRGSFDCDVFHGERLVSELSYPRVRSLSTPLLAADAFADEAFGIAAREEVSNA